MAVQWTIASAFSKAAKRNRRRREIKESALTSSDYHARDVARTAKFRIIDKKYADATIKTINRVHRFWDRWALFSCLVDQYWQSCSHCVFMQIDCYFHLAASKTKSFRRYVDWRLKKFQIIKQSTIWIEWKFLRLLYKREPDRKLDEMIEKQVSEISATWAVIKTNTTHVLC